jgi:hypothetical protein
MKNAWRLNGGSATCLKKPSCMLGTSAADAGLSHKLSLSSNQLFAESCWRRVDDDLEVLKVSEVSSVTLEMSFTRVLRRRVYPTIRRSRKVKSEKSHSEITDPIRPSLRENWRENRRVDEFIRGLFTNGKFPGED